MNFAPIVTAAQGECRHGRASRRPARRLSALVLPGALLLLPAACDTPHTYVLFQNDYPASAAEPLVVYQAVWQAVRFQTPVRPGTSSDPEPTVAASDNVAYVALAPGWDPRGPRPPTSYVVLESRTGFGIHLNDTLTIPVDDSTFAGNCAAGDALSQPEADFLTQRVFASLFAGKHYDASTCTTTKAVAEDAGAKDGGARDGGFE